MLPCVIPLSRISTVTWKVVPFTRRFIPLIPNARPIGMMLGRSFISVFNRVPVCTVFCCVNATKVNVAVAMKPTRQKWLRYTKLTMSKVQFSKLYSWPLPSHTTSLLYTVAKVATASSQKGALFGGSIRFIPSPKIIPPIFRFWRKGTRTE